VEVWVLVLRFFTFLSTAKPGFSLSSDPGGRMAGKRRKAGI